MSFYNEQHVAKGRKVKECCRCHEIIDKGEPSVSVPNDSCEFTYILCMSCYDECEKLGIDDINEAQKDEEEEEEYDENEGYEGEDEH